MEDDHKTQFGDYDSILTTPTSYRYGAGDSDIEREVPVPPTPCNTETAYQCRNPDPEPAIEIIPVKPHWTNEQYDRRAEGERHQQFPTQFLVNPQPNQKPAFYGKICQNQHQMDKRELVLDQIRFYSHWISLVPRACRSSLYLIRERLIRFYHGLRILLH